MDSPSPPAAPDPTKVANAQLKYGQQAGQSQQALNMTDQSNPFGSLDYSVTGIDPVTGLPTYGAKQQYTPEQQALFDAMQGTKGAQGSAGFNLANNAFGMYSQMPDLGVGTNSRVTQGMDRALPYMERFMAPEREQLDTQLRNSGILPGTPAYQQQVDKLNAQQDLTKGNWLNTFQAQAFDQAKQEYQLPEQMIQQLMQTGAPGDLKSSFGTTPQTGVQTPDYQAATQAQYNAQYQAYQQKVAQQNAQMSAMIGVPLALAGMPVAGGGSVGGNMMKGIFG